jgi:hypothetical protein
MTTLKAKSGDPVNDPSSIGNVLIRLGRVSGEQLATALAKQHEFGEHLLGAWLKELGYVNDLDVALAMKIQAEIRGGKRLCAELDVLQAKMDEVESCAREFSRQLCELEEKKRPSGKVLAMRRQALAAD